MKFARISGLILLCALMTMMISCGVQLAKATTSDMPDPIGQITPHSNPNASLVGSLVEGREIQDSDGRVGTSLLIHPLATYGLYDESIVFCGDESPRVTTDDGRLILGNYAYIYRREASRLINGVPCYALRGVYKLEEKR